MALTDLGDILVPFEDGRFDFGYEDRIQSLIRKLDHSAVEGTQKLTQVPAGWIGTLEVFGDYLIQDSNNRILDMSEKFGRLRAHIQNKKTGLFDLQAKAWCEEMTQKR